MESSPLSRATSLSQSAFKESLAPKLRDIARSQEQLSTGLQVNRASDDASAFQKARKLELLQLRYEQYERSMSDARAWLDHTQENLDLLADVLTEAYEEGVRSINSTLEDDERENAAVFLENILENVLELLNSKAGDEYLYSGTRTAVKPFSVDPLDPTRDGADVVYYGNADALPRQIGPDALLPVNISGTRVLNVDHDGDGAADFTVSESLQNMINALRANDLAASQTGLDQIQSARDHFINLGSEIGSAVNRLDLSQSQLAASSISLARQRSQTEDADLAEVILEFQRAQTSLQASLQITSSLLDTSLLNFI